MEWGCGRRRPRGHDSRCGGATDARRRFGVVGARRGASDARRQVAVAAAREPARGGRGSSPRSHLERAHLLRRGDLREVALLRHHVRARNDRAARGHRRSGRGSGSVDRERSEDASPPPVGARRSAQPTSSRARGGGIFIYIYRSEGHPPRSANERRQRAARPVRGESRRRERRCARGG